LKLGGSGLPEVGLIVLYTVYTYAKLRALSLISIRDSEYVLVQGTLSRNWGRKMITKVFIVIINTLIL
jgi:hypothetical protein